MRTSRKDFDKAFAEKFFIPDCDENATVREGTVAQLSDNKWVCLYDYGRKTFIAFFSIKDQDGGCDVVAVPCSGGAVLKDWVANNVR